jgi:DNA-binding response OmpR family regulator
MAVSDSERRLIRENVALRERVRQLESQFMPHVSVSLRPEWGLTRSEELLFTHLSEREMANQQELLSVLYGPRVAPPDERILGVFVYNMRRKLRNFGINISTVRGYTLKPALPAPSKQEAA